MYPPDTYDTVGDTYYPPTSANLTIPYATVLPTSTTSITFIAQSSLANAGSYGGAITSYSFNDPDFVINESLGVFNKTGLTPGVSYTLRIRAYANANQTGAYGEYYYVSFTMPKTSNVGVLENTLTPSVTPDATGSSYATKDNREVSRSMFSIINKNNDRNQYSVAEKDFGIGTGYSYYMFGTGLIFPSVLTQPASAGGIGFFTNGTGSQGYFVEIQTDRSFKDTKDQAVKIFKVVGKDKKQLPDSQNPDSNTLYGGVLESVEHKVDIKVKIDDAAKKTTIDVYINNFKITAVDSFSTSATAAPIEKKISPTSYLALFSLLYKTSFDYAYAMPITEADYQKGILDNIYNGQYGNALLNFAYGNRVIDSLNNPTEKFPVVEEFGTVARELHKVKTNFDQPGAYPLYATVGVNKFANVIGSKFSNHGAEMYVVNNAGTFLPLQSGPYSFIVIGDYVSVNGQIEYTEKTINENTTPEPAVFESTWIQTESDAKALFKWISNQWSKQQQSIQMEVFANPSLEVGDIITVNYPENNLDGTQKFVITSVSNSFGEGMSTTITARSIYS